MQTTPEQRQWRRHKTLELSSQGYTERDIASQLQVSLGTVNHDIHVLKNLAKANISKYVNEVLPLEYQKCMIGLDAILVKSWTTANNTEDKREQIQALSLAKECYAMKLDLLSSATVIDRAIKFVDKHQNMIVEVDKQQIDFTES